MVAAKDPGKAHFYISLVKSVMRMIGAGFLMLGWLGIGGGTFLLAEILGIAEEIV